MSEPLSRLRAGLDRDEAIARAIDDKQEDSGWGTITHPGVSGFTISPHIGRVHESEAAAHIVRFGPDRALRQTAAFRKLLAEYDSHLVYGPPFEDSELEGNGPDIWEGRDQVFKMVFELLASIYPEEGE